MPLMISRAQRYKVLIQQSVHHSFHAYDVTLYMQHDFLTIFRETKDQHEMHDNCFFLPTIC